jgi:hypothetical protein
MLVQEPQDAADTIYGDILEVVPPGLDSPLVGPAATLVDSFFNGPPPLANAIDMARDLVNQTFQAAPEGGPLRSAVRDLGFLIYVSHAEAGRLFTAYARAIGVPPGQNWVVNYVLAGLQAMVALEWLHAAARDSLVAERFIRFEHLAPCERMAAAVVMLRRAIRWACRALSRLRLMRRNLVALDQIVINATGQAPPLP